MRVEIKSLKDIRLIAENEAEEAMVRDWFWGSYDMATHGPLEGLNNEKEIGISIQFLEPMGTEAK